MPASTTPAVRTPTTTFRYGEYELAFPLTKQYSHEPVYDPSGTDVMYTRHTLRIQGVLYPGAEPLQDGSAASLAETAAQKLRRIEHDLLRPRQILEYSQNGKMILQVNELDAENGPKPQSFNVVMTLQESITVEFTVLVSVVGCINSQARRMGYTSNRWSESEDYDEAGYCSLTTRGLLIVASDLNSNPDALRSVVAPVIRRGYQRMSSNYTLSEDGLRLAYSFVDKEFYLGPPTIAMKASGRFMVIQLPGQYVAQTTVRLEGAKGVSKNSLMYAAARIVNAKVNSIVPVKDGKSAPIVTHASYSEELFENVVEVSFRCAIDHKRLGTTGTGVRMDVFGTELPGCVTTDQPGIAPPLRGNNQFLQLLCATFNDPCVMVSILASGGITEGMLTGAGAAAPLGEGGELRTGPGLVASTAPAQPPGQLASLSAGPPGAAGRRAGGLPGPGDRVAAVHPSVYNLPPPQGTNPASIVVGRIPVAAATTNETQIPYERYEIRMSYLNRTGFTVMPSSWFDATKIGTTDPSSAFNKAGFAKSKKVRIQSPSLRMVVEWSAERVGSPPEIPDPCPSHDNESDCNFVLIEDGITVDQIDPVIGSGYRHSVSGRYVYDAIDTTLVPLASALPPFVQAEVIEKINAGDGTLQQYARTERERQIAEIDAQIQTLYAAIESIAQDGITAGTVADAELARTRIAIKEKLIAILESQRGTILDTPLGGGGDWGVSANAIQRRKEGDYILNSGIIWFRLKTLKPGPLFEDCPCDDGLGGSTLTQTGTGNITATLTGNPPRVIPNP